MIQKLRRRHFQIMVVLAIVIPLVFVLVLAYRQPIPAMSEFPSALAPRLSRSQAVWHQETRIGEVAAVLSTSKEGASWLLDIQPANELAHPDLLVYAGGTETTALDQDYLLGTMAGSEARRFSIPEALAGKGFSLKFYSMAHRNLVAVTALPGEATTSAERDL